MIRLLWNMWQDNKNLEALLQNSGLLICMIDRHCTKYDTIRSRLLGCTLLCRSVPLASPAPRSLRFREVLSADSVTKVWYPRLSGLTQWRRAPPPASGAILRATHINDQNGMAVADD